MSDPSKPFFGLSNAKGLRKRLLHFVEVVKNIGDHHFALEQWVLSRKDEVEWGVCHFCKKDTPFYSDICLACNARERSLDMIESDQGKLDEAEKALQGKEPFFYLGRALANGPCDLHPELSGEAHVLTLFTTPEKEPLRACGACARIVLQRMLVDYWRESRNLQSPGESRIFWGKDPLLKGNIIDVKAA